MADGTHALTLRPYQENALDKIRDCFRRGKKRGMLYSPTGSGKTEIALAIILAVLAKGGKAAFIVNRKELLNQASRRLTAAGIAHGIIQADNTRGLDAKALVCSIDTVARRGLPMGLTLIIIDEAHAVAGSTKYRELLKQRNAIPVIGLSATPFSPGLGAHCAELGGPLFEELIEAITIRELIDLGHLVDVDCYAPAVPDLTGVKTQRGMGGELDYNETQLAEAMNKPALTGDVVQHWKRYAAGKQTVVFAVAIAHSMAIVAEFQAAGIPAEHVDYHHTDEERAAILGRFASGETRILSNSALLAEGWDCPQAACMILARPTKSRTRYIQMVGRVLRPFEGKTKAILLDHSGTVLRLGFATDDLPLELDDGAANKAGKQKAAKKPSEPKPCGNCHFVKPAGVHACPQCGFAPTRQSDVEIADGELVKLDRKKPVSADTKQHVYSQLLQVCRTKGYKSGWAANKYRDKFGVWPRNLRDVEAAPTTEILSWLKSQQIRFAHARGKEANHGQA